MASLKRRHYKPAKQRPWSKLQREIYKLLLPELKLQIHCEVYRMDSQSGSTDLPRYWISLDREFIFDYPKYFPCKQGVPYPYLTDISDISALIREYIDTPKLLLLEKNFTHDYWGLADILRAADRRISLKKLQALYGETDDYAVQRVLECRRNLKKGQFTE